MHNMQYNETPHTPSLIPGSFSSIRSLSSKQAISFMMQYQNIPTTNLNALDNKHWSTATSPFPYEIVLSTTNVVKCYGCPQKFVHKCRIPPYNIVVKHKDRKIRGYNPDGCIMFAPDFQNTYYHINTTHVLGKNPEFNNKVSINDNVIISLPSEHMEVINKSGLIISVWTRNHNSVVDETATHLTFRKSFVLLCFPNIALRGIYFFSYLMISILEIV